MRAACKYLALLCLMFAPQLALAENDPPTHWLVLSGVSQHLKNANQYNQNNQGLGFEWGFKNTYVSQTRLVIGRFLNSDRHYSNYAGVLATPVTLSESAIKVRVGAVLGIINGYPKAWNGRYFPLFAPVVDVSYGNVGANIFIIPPVQGIPETLALQLKIGF